MAYENLAFKYIFSEMDDLLIQTYCSDFRYESNGIFVLGVGFFFFRQISTF